MILISRPSDLHVHRNGGTCEPELVQAALERCLVASGRDPARASRRDWYHATAMLARELLAGRWLASRREQERWLGKRVYYLSMEFLPGRLLGDALRNLGIHEACRLALAGAGHALEEIEAEEADQALGSGGLGRLAACLMDSLASAGIAGYGYGLRFEFGQFAQAIQDGWQVEHPDRWLARGNGWEFPHPELAYRVSFGSGADAASDVLAIPHDIPVCGYGSDSVNTLRVWSARSVGDFDSAAFQRGDHVAALDRRAEAENLTRVLYPSDAHEAGRRLRFRQEHFFVSASVQDILAQYRAAHGSFDGGFERLPDKAAIAINDTHPALVIPELMRQLVDDHGLAWGRAWEITRNTVHYTNHTLMPEALETWPVHFFENLLPRQLDIVYRINHEYLSDVRARRPGDEGLVQRLSMVDEHGERRIRMAHLAFVGSRRINGVSQIHTELMKRTLFRDFLDVQPGKIVNVTNGITPRRWLAGANPALAALVTSRIGDGWMSDAGALRRLEPLADDAQFRAEFRAVKLANKQRLAQHAFTRCGLRLAADSLFDVHVKRIHEYKRQLMKLLHVVTLYDRIRSGRAGEQMPRTVVFAGKAAPGYAMAKLIVKLIHDVAETVNRDPAAGDRLKVLFLPNYSVSEAETIIPAADLSEQISTAGTEASGTGNMKFALNGALTIGTLDGANIEIAEAVGAENFFAFGLGVEEIDQLRGHYVPRRLYESDAELRRAIDMIADGTFSPDEPQRFRRVVDSLLDEDRFFLLADYGFYLRRQDEAEAAYRDPESWSRSAILNVARIGHLSSDRAIRDYAEHVWQVQPADRAALGPALVEA